jgi:hypothetical protein
MLLLVLGAGASFDAVPDRPAGTVFDHRLPLANEMFENRPEFRNDLAAFPELNAAIPHLINIPDSETIETRIQRLQDQADNADAARAQQLIAMRFYLSNMIWRCEQRLHETARGITNHLTLLDEIQRRTALDEQVFIVTFNYDCLIERALNDNRFESIRGYTQHERYKLIKLHGSANWGRRLVKDPIFSGGGGAPNHQIVRSLIDIAPTIELRHEYFVVQDPRIPVLDGFPVVPAIAIPIQHKSDFECPQEHVVALTDFLPRVTKILVIGWKAAEDAFLQLLAKNLKITSVAKNNPSITIVGGSDADTETTKANLENRGIRGNFTLYGNGFTSFSQSINTTNSFDNFMGPRA